jgi:hypothetical protein
MAEVHGAEAAHPQGAPHLVTAEGCGRDGSGAGRRRHSWLSGHRVRREVRRPLVQRRGVLRIASQVRRCCLSPLGGHISSSLPGSGFRPPAASGQCSWLTCREVERHPVIVVVHRGAGGNTERFVAGFAACPDFRPCSIGRYTGTSLHASPCGLECETGDHPISTAGVLAASTSAPDRPRRDRSSPYPLRVAAVGARDLSGPSIGWPRANLEQLDSRSVPGASFWRSPKIDRVMPTCWVRTPSNWTMAPAGTWRVITAGVAVESGRPRQTTRVLSRPRPGTGPRPGVA